MATINSNVARPIRTGIQGTVAFAIVEFLDAFFLDMDQRQYGALVVVLTLAISAIQNFSESKLGVALLRNLPAREVDVLEKENDNA